LFSKRIRLGSRCVVDFHIAGVVTRDRKIGSSCDEEMQFAAPCNKPSAVFDPDPVSGNPIFLRGPTVQVRRRSQFLSRGPTVHQFFLMHPLLQPVFTTFVDAVLKYIPIHFSNCHGELFSPVKLAASNLDAFSRPGIKF
jgi:hypothetical protein